MRHRETQAPWAPPLNVILVGCGAVARTYYLPALERLFAAGWLGATRAFDPNAKRASEIAS